MASRPLAWLGDPEAALNGVRIRASMTASSPMRPLYILGTGLLAEEFYALGADQRVRRSGVRRKSGSCEGRKHALRALRDLGGHAAARCILRLRAFDDHAHAIHRTGRQPGDLRHARSPEQRRASVHATRRRDRGVHRCADWQQQPDRPARLSQSRIARGPSHAHRRLRHDPAWSQYRRRHRDRRRELHRHGRPHPRAAQDRPWRDRGGRLSREARCSGPCPRRRVTRRRS